MADVIEKILRIKDEASGPTKAVAATTDKAAKSSKGLEQGLDEAGGAMRKLRGAANALSPELGALVSVIDDGADVGEAFLGMSGPLALALGAIAAAAGVAYVAWRSYNEDTERSAKIAAAQSAAFEALTPILDSTRQATIDLRVATGELSEMQGDLETNAIRAHAALQAATKTSRENIAALHAEQASLKTQMVDFAESASGAMGPLGFVMNRVVDALTSSSSELQTEIDGERASIAAATTATKENIKVTEDAIRAKDKLAKSTKASASDFEFKSGVSGIVLETDQISDTQAVWDEWHAKQRQLSLQMDIAAQTAGAAIMKQAEIEGHEAGAAKFSGVMGGIAGMASGLSGGAGGISSSLSSFSGMMVDMGKEAIGAAAANAGAIVAAIVAIMQLVTSIVPNKQEAYDTAYSAAVASGATTAEAKASGTEAASKETGMLDDMHAFVMEFINELPSLATVTQEFIKTTISEGIPALISSLIQVIADPATYVGIITAMVDGIAGLFDTLFSAKFWNDLGKSLVDAFAKIFATDKHTGGLGDTGFLDLNTKSDKGGLFGTGFLDMAPKRASGGYVNRTGLALIHQGEEIKRRGGADSGTMAAQGGSQRGTVKSRGGEIVISFDDLHRSMNTNLSRVGGWSNG